MKYSISECMLRESLAKMLKEHRMRNTDSTKKSEMTSVPRENETLFDVQYARMDVFSQWNRPEAIHVCFMRENNPAVMFLTYGWKEKMSYYHTRHHSSGQMAEK